MEVDKCYHRLFCEKSIFPKLFTTDIFNFRKKTCRKPYITPFDLGGLSLLGAFCWRNILTVLVFHSNDYWFTSIRIILSKTQLLLSFKIEPHSNHNVYLVNSKRWSKVSQLYQVLGECFHFYNPYYVNILDSLYYLVF